MKQRLLASLLTLALLGASAVQAAPPPDPTQNVVKDPHYGDVLFEFFQDHYFQAITGLMVSQQFGRVSHHAEEAEVLRGGMLLSYGMQQEAGAIFERLIDLHATPATRDRAWFYLAKIRYQRGYFADAENALNRIGANLEPALLEELGLLRAQLRMAAGDYAAAAQRLSAMDSKSPSARYIRFNLGVALIKSGEAQRGTAVLDALGKEPAENEEYRDLRDRANLALGFAALASEQLPEARNYLERVRLKGMQANKALLGLGWAASAQKLHKVALVPWMELLQRDISDPAVLEAFIAAPYAYAELGAYRQAADGYTKAIATFEQETAAIDTSIAALRTGELVQQLVERNPGGDMGWFWGMRNLPDKPGLTQLASHLVPVLAQHEFQEALKNYRDLLFIERNLQEWSDKLGTFDDMLANRQKAYAERLPAIQQRANADGQAANPLRQRQQELMLLLQQGEADADGKVFANAKELALMQRLQRVQTALASAPASEETALLQERARITTGVLNWNLAQDYPVRVWQTKQALQSTEASLEKAQQSEVALLQAQRDEPARFAAFGKRIADLGPSLAQQLTRVAALRQAQQQALTDLAVADLQRQQKAMGEYTTQARFALAQLYDRATSGGGEGQEAEHAKP